MASQPSPFVPAAYSSVIPSYLAPASQRGTIGRAQRQAAHRTLTNHTSGPVAASTMGPKPHRASSGVGARRHALIAARVPGLGATRPPHHGAWSIGAAGGTGKTTLLPYCRTAGHLVRPLGTAREARTDLRGKPRPTERTNARALPCRISTQMANAKRLSPEPREGSMRQGMAPPPHLRRRIYHQHPMPYPHHHAGRAPTLGQEQSLTRG